MSTVGFAILPILVIFVMLFLFKQSVLRASVFSYVIALLITLVTPEFHLGKQEIFQATIKGILISSMVAYVLLFGILLFHLMNEMHVIHSIASFISSSTKDPIRQVILLVVTFSPLVESVSGFGIAIIVVAPILIVLGFDRYKAALLSLVSLSAVPWGALATGTVIAANLSGVPVPKLGSGSAILSVPTFLYFTLIAVYLTMGWKGIKERWAELLIISGSLAGSVWIFNTFISVELAGVFGALVAVGVELIFIRFSKTMQTTEEVTISRLLITEEVNYSILKAMSPYLVLTALLFISRMAPGIGPFLLSHCVLVFSSYSYSLPILYSPGFFLLIVCLFTIYIFQIERSVIRKAIQSTLKQWIPVILSTIFFVAMSEVMSEAGMTNIIARLAASTLGVSFIFFSPLIGGLGGFLTGSNTGSNAMFIKLQLQAASQLGMSPEMFTYGQNTSASHMTMASPSRVLLAQSVCEIDSKNNLLKQISLIAIGSLILLIVEIILLKS